MQFDLTRRLAAEALGTLILVMAVVGSGIMAEKLAGGNQALALLCNTIATGAVLFVIITIFAPVSGAHFNPAVSLVMLYRGALDLPTAVAYVVVQIVGGCVGAVLAHLMFGLDLIQLGSTARTGIGQWAGEFIATFGLIATILGCIRFKPEAVATAVGLYITSAYWFTASTSFANPAVTIARSLSNTFAGIAPADAPGFIVAELLGAFAAAVLFGWLFAAPVRRSRRRSNGRRGRDRTQARILGFELGDAPFEALDGRGNILGEEHLRDMLRAVRVPGLDGEDDGLLGARLVALGEQRGGERGIVLDRARRAPDLHPHAVGVVHQEQRGLGIVGEIAGRDVLAVAAEIGEAERLLVEHAQEAGRTAAMLNIRLAVGIDRREIE